MKFHLSEIVPGIIATAMMGAMLFALLVLLATLVELWRRWRGPSDDRKDLPATVVSLAEARRNPTSPARSRARP